MPTWISQYKDNLYIQIYPVSLDLTVSLIKYNLTTGEFTKITESMPLAYQLDVIGDKLVMLNGYGGRTGFYLTVLDLLTDQILVEYKDIVTHD